MSSKLCARRFKELSAQIRRELDIDKCTHSVDIEFVKDLAQDVDFDRKDVCLLCVSNTAYQYLYNCREYVTFPLFVANVIKRLRDDV